MQTLDLTQQLLPICDRLELGNSVTAVSSCGEFVFSGSAAGLVQW